MGQSQEALILLVIILALLDAYFDFRIIDKGGEIRHGLEALIRGLIFLGLAIVTGSIILNFLLYSVIFWIVFEASLNLLRKRNILYIGYTAWSDKLIRSIFGQNAEIALIVIKTTILCLLLNMQG